MSDFFQWHDILEASKVFMLMSQMHRNPLISLIGFGI
jgi:hypothetical protein